MTAQSNVTSSIACAVSISGKLDSIQAQQGEILSRLSSLESKISGLEGRIDAINNAIDSLENVLTTTINSIKDVLLAAINRLFDLLSNLFGGGNNDRTDEVLNAIENAKNQLGNAIVDTASILGRNIINAIDGCCAHLEALIRAINSGDEQAILDAINRLEGSIRESIGGAENRLTGEINQNESKLDIIIGKLGEADWVTRILAAIAALANLLKDNSCDLDQVIVTVNSCCRLLEALIKNIDCDSEGIKNAINSSRNYLATKIDSNIDISSNTYNNTNTILNTINNFNSQINNVYNNIQNLQTTVNNYSNNIQNLQTTVNNYSNYNQTDINNITNQVSNINNQITNLIQQCIDDGDGGLTLGIEYKFIQVPVFVRCNPITNAPEFTVALVKVIKELESQELLKFQRIAEIEAKLCERVEAVALMPEWWQLRIEGGTPQLVVAFGEVDASTGKCLHATYSMTIPHFMNIKPAFCPFPRYKKGNWELIGVMKDNSKLIINAFNEYECLKVYNAILPWIEEEFRRSIKVKIGRRIDYKFKEVWVCPRFGKFFGTGNRKLDPDWTVYFEPTD